MEPDDDKWRSHRTPRTCAKLPPIRHFFVPLQGLGRAVTDVFGFRGVVQRCQIHTWRNVPGRRGGAAARRRTGRRPATTPPVTTPGGRDDPS